MASVLKPFLHAHLRSKKMETCTIILLCIFIGMVLLLGDADTVPVPTVNTLMSSDMDADYSSDPHSHQPEYGSGNNSRSLNHHALKHEDQKYKLQKEDTVDIDINLEDENERGSDTLYTDSSEGKRLRFEDIYEQQHRIEEESSNREEQEQAPHVRHYNSKTSPSSPGASRTYADKLNENVMEETKLQGPSLHFNYEHSHETLKAALLLEKPVNLTATWVTDSMIELTWMGPPNFNHEKLDGYRIYYMQNNFTEVINVTDPTEPMKYVLMNLAAFTEHRIWVKAFTSEDEGEPSDSIVVKTDVRGPFPPRITNVSCLSESDAVFVSWQRPIKYYHSVDYYYVEYRGDPSFDFEELTLKADTNTLEYAITIRNLTTNLTYEIKVRAGTKSVLEDGRTYRGHYSSSKKILLQETCESYRRAAVGSSIPDFTPQIIIVSICISLLIVMMLIGFVIWRRYFQGAYYYLDDPPKLPPIGRAEGGEGTGWEGDSTDELKRAIPSHHFARHVAELHADGDIGFSKEYEIIQSCSVQDEFTSEHSQHPENKQKNRYLNIVAYDHTRVQMQPASGQKKAVDYVNANYIDGFRKAQAYIGTQGPLPSTFDTFWRMVWEHSVEVIVMITNLVERGSKKCDMYWPKEGTETYGFIQVRLIKEDVMATFTVRTFQMQCLKSVNNGSQYKTKSSPVLSERVLYHYHYTNWPDHGTPSHPLPVLNFVKKSSSANSTDGGPIIVHCSAGVGRTGTYIVLDAMLRQVQERGDVNIFGFLKQIRTQRNFLVQTEEQYIFTHDALLEAIESGETSINKTQLSEYTNSLVSTSYRDEKEETSNLLDKQYKMATNYVPKEFSLSSALKPCNLIKNRNLDCVCTDMYRVTLTPKPGVEGSDYVNASFLPGYHRAQEFIVSQHPFENTVPEFWQMLWDHSVHTVVLLSEVNEEYPVFWPSTTEEDMELTNVRAKLLSESTAESFTVREFSLHSLSPQDESELGVKIVYCPQWPRATPTTAVFELIDFVQKIQLEDSLSPRPTVVVDRFGGVEAATFCILTTLSKHTKLEDSVDIYMYSKLYHEQRPGIWRSLDDYLFLYRCTEALCFTATHANNGEVLHSPTSPTCALLQPNKEEETESTTSRGQSPSTNLSLLINGHAAVQKDDESLKSSTPDDEPNDPMIVSLA